MHREALLAIGPFVGGMALSVGAAAWLVRCSGARPAWRQLRRLHGDEHGAVQSLSFVLTLPLFVMVMLFIVQLSQLTLGRLTLEFAAFAAARSAMVWIPAQVDQADEQENRAGSQRVQVGFTADEAGNQYTVYRLLPGGRKFEKVRLAAAMALMAVCPSRSAASNDGSTVAEAVQAMQGVYLALAPASAANPRIGPRLLNKLAYAWESTDVQIDVWHRVTEPDLMWHDIGPDTDEYASNEIAFQDQLHVTVNHRFALLPGPGRFLARPAPIPRPGGGFEPDRVAARIREVRGNYVYGMSATVRLKNEGEKSMLPFDQPLDGGLFQMAGGS